MVAAVIIEPEGEPKKTLRVTLPLGMRLGRGTRIIVDSNSPLQSPYVICFANGCLADYEATPELLASMKNSQKLVVQAVNFNANGASLTLPLPLQSADGASFAKAYDGPPTDPKVFEEKQKKLQEELQKRAANRPSDPQTANASKNDGEIRVKMLSNGGTFHVPVLINGALTLNFVVDSGASDVSIPSDVVSTLLRTGTISESDFIGSTNHRLADGSIVSSRTFMIRSLKVGDRTVANVRASATNVNGMLLLGQSFLSRFKSWSQDNSSHELVLQ